MIKKTDSVKFIFLLLFFCISLFSCGYKKEEAKKYLPGQYFYDIPSGESQLLIINPDFTFKQIVYSKNRNRVLYDNRGKMYADGNKLEFGHWLECFKLADQKMLAKPFIAYSMGNYWVKPKGKEDVLIIKFDQTDYIFRKKNNSDYSSF